MSKKTPKKTSKKKPSNRPDTLKPPTYTCLLELPKHVSRSEVKDLGSRKFQRSSHSIPPVSPDVGTCILAKTQQQVVNTSKPSSRRSTPALSKVQTKSSPSESIPLERKTEAGTPSSQPATKASSRQKIRPILSIRLQMPGHRPREFVLGSIGSHKSARAADTVCQQTSRRPDARKHAKGAALQKNENKTHRRPRKPDEDSLVEAVYCVIDNIEDRARAAGVKHVPTAK